MTRTDYLAELAKYLKKLPKEDYLEAMEYYVEYFDEAGPEKEREVIEELGNPKDVANEIIATVLDKHLTIPEKTPKNTATIIGLTVLTLCAAPIALPMLLALVLFIIACVVAGLAIIAAIYIVGLAGIIMAVVTTFESLTLLAPSIKAQTVVFGGALISFGGGILIWIIATALLRFLGRATIAIIKWISSKKGTKV